MTRFVFPAIIKYARSDRAYTVTFPDLPGCVTFGDTLDGAKRMAAEALSGYLASIFERNVRMPKPSKPKGKSAYLIRPETPVLAALSLRVLREELRLSQTEAAKRLGITYQAYQRLENPRSANPTLRTLEKVAKALGKRLVLTLEDGAEAA